MAVHIRLRRIGKNPKKRPHFRVTVFDQRTGRDSRFIEEIGFYNPVTGIAKINKERIDYWVKNGAQVSLTIKSLVKKIQKTPRANGNCAGVVSLHKEAKNAAGK